MRELRPSRYSHSASPLHRLRSELFKSCSAPSFTMSSKGCLIPDSTPQFTIKNRTAKILDETKAAPAIRNFSTGMAAKQVFGAEQKQYKKQLIALKTRNESENSSSHVMQQEDLQDWLDNLQFRLSEACNISSGGTPPAGGSMSPAGLPMGTTVPPIPGISSSSGGPPLAEKRAMRSKKPFPFLENLQQAEDTIPKDGKLGGKGAVSSRSRSANNVQDSILAALTDRDYLEELQERLQKESISSLHERLAERKVKEQDPKPKTGVRPKALAKHSKKKKQADPSDATPRERGKSTKSSDESDSVASVSSSRSADSLNNYVKHQAMARIHRSPIRVENFFDQSERIDDIYMEADLIILPPARQEMETCLEVIEVGRVSPILQLPDDVEIEDFWEVQKSIGKPNN